MLSWLLRLDTRLGVSLQALAREAFGIEDCSVDSSWWSRPDPWMLKRISDSTAVDIHTLRTMTLHDWQPPVREDEVTERFGARVYSTRPPEHRALRLALCMRCLEEDSIPYLRLTGMLGWVAVCPRHETVLVTRCMGCASKVRLPRFSFVVPFAPHKCTHCGMRLLDGDCGRAHPLGLRLQAALLQCKRYGAMELEGIGRLTWSEALDLIDVLLGTL